MGSQYTSQGPRESFMSYEKYLESLKQMLTLSFQIMRTGSDRKNTVQEGSSGQKQIFQYRLLLEVQFALGALVDKGL